MNAIITGSTKGIGRALALKFASEGFDVALSARTQADLDQLKQKIENNNPGRTAHVYACDMAVKEEVEQFAAFCKERLDHVDVLINNAGLFLPGQLHNEEEGTLEKLININLYSAYYFTRAMIDRLIDQQKGHIFNMCSVASFMAYQHGGSYSVAKFALLGFSKSLREEMKDKGIRVTSVMPGATFTPSWEGIDLPESRFMKVEDVASAVYNAYTLSDQTVMEELVLRPHLGDV